MAKQTRQPKQGKQSPLDKKIQQAAALIKGGRSNEVLTGLRELAKRVPRDFRIFDLMCSACMSLGRHAEAIDAGRRAVELNPQLAETRMRFAKALQGGGEYEEAIVEIERALYRDPKNIEFARGKLSVYVDLGDQERALEVLRGMEEMVRKDGRSGRETIGLVLDKARLAPKTIASSEAIADLEPLAEDESIDKGFRVIAHHHIGRLCEIEKEDDRAFEHWAKGNELKKPDWNPDVLSGYIDKLIKCWEKIEKVPVVEHPTIDSSRLVFIVGMMRSGTSLTEQMVAQIPGVTPGGEMNAIARVPLPFEPLPNPTGGRALPVTRMVYNQRVINQMSKDAAKFYEEVAAEGIVTDKQPYNIFYVPLISRLFPGAKVIHCCRDAQDCCLSNFIQTFARPHPQTHDLYWMGRYHADYQRMMDAWHKLPGVDMLDLHYEDVVSDPETQSRRVCEYLGQPWTEDMLNFHQSSRTVRTASRDQVRKPIYKSSVKKYERFADHLEPLRRGLGLE